MNEQTINQRARCAAIPILDPILDPEHEPKKRELRSRLKAEHSAPAYRVVSQQEIVIKDAAYWTHPTELRLKYMKEAEEARKKWAKKLKKNQH